MENLDLNPIPEITAFIPYPKMISTLSNPVLLRESRGLCYLIERCPKPVGRNSPETELYRCLSRVRRNQLEWF